MLSLASFLYKENTLDNSNTVVIVLSRNYSTGLGVIRSLGMAGYTVDLIASTKKAGSSLIPSSSKYVRKSVEVLSRNIQTDSGENLVKEILNYKKQSNHNYILFPTDDFTAKVVATNYDKLCDDFIIPHIDGKYPCNLIEAMDKSIQHKIAKQSGLLTPKEWIVDLNGTVEIDSNIVYPCFVKPYQSVYGSKSEMAVINDSDTLYKHLIKLQKALGNRKILIQEYLIIDKEFDISGVCNNQEIIIPAVIEKTRISKHETGVTLSGRVLPKEILGDTFDKIVKMLQHYHYNGMFDMELALCGGKLYFNEINFRSGGPNYAYQLCGVNLPDISVKKLMGIPHNADDETIKTFGKTFVYEKVAWEDYINSHISKKQLKECINGSDFTLLNDSNDKAPGKNFAKRIRLSRLKHLLLSVIGKEKKSFPAAATDKGNVIIVGCNYCNVLTMARALSKGGYKINVLRVFKTKPSLFKPLQSMTPESKSKHINKYRKCIAVNNDSETIKSLIDMAKNEKSLLLPTDDYTCRIVDNNIDKLSKHFYIPGINKKQGETVKMMDKQLQKTIAKKHNIPTLNGITIKVKNSSFNIPQDISYPCFMKPNVSTNNSKSKMKKCADESELKLALESLSKVKELEVLIEPYADIKSEYSLLGVCAGGKISIPSMLQITHGGHRQRKGVAIAGKVSNCEKIKEITENCKKFVLSLNYTGLFDIDLIETVSGEIYFLELNFRAGASAQALTAHGINLPRMLADYMLQNQDICTGFDIQPTSSGFASEKILTEEYARGDISKADALKLINESDILFVKDYDDIKPSNNLKKYTVIIEIIRIFYKLKGIIK